MIIISKIIIHQYNNFKAPKLFLLDVQNMYVNFNEFLNHGPDGFFALRSAKRNFAISSRFYKYNNKTVYIVDTDFT